MEIDHGLEMDMIVVIFSILLHMQPNIFSGNGVLWILHDQVV